MKIDLSICLLSSPYRTSITTELESLLCCSKERRAYLSVWNSLLPRLLFTVFLHLLVDSQRNQDEGSRAVLSARAKPWKLPCAKLNLGMNGRFRVSGFCLYLRDLSSTLRIIMLNGMSPPDAMTLILDVYVDRLRDLARALQLVC